MIKDWRRIVRFLLIGGLNTAVGYCLYAGLVLSGLAPGWSVTLATIAGCLFNFFSYGSVVFGSIHGRSLAPFILVYASMAVLNVLLLRLLSHWGLAPLSAQAVLLPVLSAYGYVGMNNFVFRRGRGKLRLWPQPR